MRILYVAMKYDYADKSRGLSFEHVTFYDWLVNVRHDLICYDYMSPFKEQRLHQMNHLVSQWQRYATRILEAYMMSLGVLISE